MIIWFPFTLKWGSAGQPRLGIIVVGELKWKCAISRSFHSICAICCATRVMTYRRWWVLFLLVLIFSPMKCYGPLRMSAIAWRNDRIQPCRSLLCPSISLDIYTVLCPDYSEIICRVLMWSIQKSTERRLNWSLSIQRSRSSWCIPELHILNIIFAAAGRTWVHWWNSAGVIRLGTKLGRSFYLFSHSSVG